MAKKKTVGAPPKYKNAEELQQQITAYFDGGMRTRKVLVGRKPNQELIEMPIPTITGLVIFIGYESRQSFYDLEKREGFSYTVKKARTFIEREYEELLQLGSTAAIFALKNFGWHDKQELDHDVSDKLANIIAKGDEIARKYEKIIKDEEAQKRSD
ncbi:hypothetical protein HQ531_04460 [bacterium]|nr:hypothetical protein [bacterium]